MILESSDPPLLEAVQPQIHAATRQMQVRGNVLYWRSFQRCLSALPRPPGRAPHIVLALSATVPALSATVPALSATVPAA
jgi:hypothetical protein